MILGEEFTPIERMRARMGRMGKVLSGLISKEDRGLGAAVLGCLCLLLFKDPDERRVADTKENMLYRHNVCVAYY
jgi:hypothetical protein